MRSPLNRRTVVSDIVISLDSSRTLVNKYLETFFETNIEAASHMSEQYAGLWRAMHALSAAGGKRLRPHLLLMTYHAYTHKSDSSTLPRVVPAAAAQEIIHLAMLIHDDIIDRDDMRYGVKNITGRYNDRYEPYVSDATERRHFANSSALMGGDVLISQAHVLLQECAVPTERILRAHSSLAEAVFSVAGGEMIDTESSFRPLSESDALLVARQKTASYTFVGPLVMGAQLADAPPSQLALLRKIGLVLGVAYQLKDDILGVFGDEEKTGKSASGDIREGKKTYMVEQFYAYASAPQVRQFEAVFARHDMTHEEIMIARTLLEKVGVRAKTEALIEEYRQNTLAEIMKLSIPDTAKRQFVTTVDACLQREK